MNPAQIFSLVVVIVVIAYDIWLYFSGRETISQMIQKLTSMHSWVAAAIGALIFHLLTGAQ